MNLAKRLLYCLFLLGAGYYLGFNDAQSNEEMIVPRTVNRLKAQMESTQSGPNGDS
jgi:hypothetical protein